MDTTPPPQPVKLIHDLETLRVLTDPLRMRILSLLSQQPRTVKEVAQALEIPPTRLYYHFNLLEKHGLIRVTATRVVSGIIEKHYQVTAYEFNVDRQLLAPNAPTAREGWQLVFSQTLGTLQRDIQHLAARGTLQALMEPEKTSGESVPVRISHALARLSRSQAQALLSRLKELVAEFEGQETSPEEETESYSLFVAFYPTPDLHPSEPENLSPNEKDPAASPKTSD